LQKTPPSISFDFIEGKNPSSRFGHYWQETGGDTKFKNLPMSVFQRCGNTCPRFQKRVKAIGPQSLIAGSIEKPAFKVFKRCFGEKIAHRICSGS